MKMLSIGKEVVHASLSITNIKESDLATLLNIQSYNYIIINGGDGTIRRVMKTLQHTQNLPPFILNPTGSFNVIAKIHRVPKIESILDALALGEKPKTQPQQIYSLNKEVFLFSAGNMGDLQHIFLAETLRFGILKNGIAKYVLSILFLLPIHLLMTPFMLLSKRKFFIFTPVSFIKKFGSFYGNIEEVGEFEIDLDNGYNHIELDGDVVTIEDSILTIAPAGDITILTL